MVNAYAAEHLEIQTRDADIVAAGVRNAGAVFVGRTRPSASATTRPGPTTSSRPAAARATAARTVRRPSCAASTSCATTRPPCATSRTTSSPSPRPRTCPRHGEAVTARFGDALSRLSELLRPELRGKTAQRAPARRPDGSTPTRTPTRCRRPSSDITAAVAEVAADLNRYPDREFELRAALAALPPPPSGVDVVADEVWAATAPTVLQHLQAFGGPGGRARVHPAYSMHPIITETLGTTWVDGLRGAGTDAPFDLTAESAVAQVREHRPNVVFLCSPNNPTGTALSLEVVAAVYDAAPDAVVVVDEAYAEFAREGTPSALTCSEGASGLVDADHEQGVRVRRGPPRLPRRAPDADRHAAPGARLPYHLSTPTQAIALAALRHAPEMLSTVAVIKAQRDRIVHGLALGLDPVAQRRQLRPLRRPARRGRHLAGAAGPGRPGPRRRDPALSSCHGRDPAETDAFLAAMAETLTAQNATVTSTPAVTSPRWGRP